jgi:hypothetical protein
MLDLCDCESIARRVAKVSRVWRSHFLDVGERPSRWRMRVLRIAGVVVSREVRAWSGMDILMVIEEKLGGFVTVRILWKRCGGSRFLCCGLMLEPRIRGHVERNCLAV